MPLLGSLRPGEAPPTGAVARLMPRLPRRRQRLAALDRHLPAGCPRDAHRRRGARSKPAGFAFSGITPFPPPDLLPTHPTQRSRDLQQASAARLHEEGQSGVASRHPPPRRAQDAVRRWCGFSRRALGPRRAHCTGPTALGLLHWAFSTGSTAPTRSPRRRGCKPRSAGRSIAPTTRGSAARPRWTLARPDRPGPAPHSTGRSVRR